MEIKIVKYRNIKGINDLLLEYTKGFYDEVYGRTAFSNMYLEDRKDVYLIKFGKNAIGAFILKYGTVYSLFINKEHRGKDVVKNVLEFSRNVCNRNIKIGAINSNIQAIKCYSKYCKKIKSDSNHWFLYKGEREFIEGKYIEGMFNKMIYMSLLSVKVNLEKYICEFKIEDDKYHLIFTHRKSGKTKMFENKDKFNLSCDVCKSKYYKMEVVK